MLLSHSFWLEERVVFLSEPFKAGGRELELPGSLSKIRTKKGLGDIEAPADIENVPSQAAGLAT